MNHLAFTLTKPQVFFELHMLGGNGVEGKVKRKAEVRLFSFSFDLPVPPPPFAPAIVLLPFEKNAKLEWVIRERSFAF